VAVSFAICDRCRRESKTIYYILDVEDVDPPDVCEECFGLWTSKKKSMFNDFMKQEKKKGKQHGP